MTKYTQHIYWAVATTLVCIFCVWCEPNLLKDFSTSLGTIGFFATTYGVIFAIIELIRAKAASELASTEVRRVLNSVTSLVTARKITKCQTLIQSIMADIDNSRTISIASINEIVNMYSQIFYTEIANPESDQRKNVSILQNIAFSPGKPSKHSHAYALLRVALHSITGQLGQLQGSTKNFTEYAQ